MDVLRINPATWTPDELVEGRTSLVWTERYQDVGEFELITPKVQYTRNLIPEGSFIGLRDSQEVMIVESHNINASGELTVTGRTFESILEQRTTVVVKEAGGPEAMWVFTDDDIWPTDAAKALIQTHITVCNESGVQQVPNTVVNNLVTAHVGTVLSYDNDPGPLYDEVLKLLKIENAGIRNQLNFNGKLLIYIYKGVDRTVDQTKVTPVVFNLGAGYLTDPSYLFSIKDYKNVAYVVGTNWQQRVYFPKTPAGISGVNRRILYVDGDSIKSTSSAARKAQRATALGRAALAQHNQTLFFDGEASPASPYTRGVDYNLGDSVTLVADYGVSQMMRISEFVRTEDQEGERAFPTLVVPDPDDD